MPRIVDKGKKAADIGAAALRIFREKGYHRTRMADIAAAAGVGKGTLYEYFANKADILRFLFEEYFLAFKEGALRAITEAERPSERLANLFEFALDHVNEWRDHCTVYVDYFGAARLGDEKLFSLRSLYDDMGSLIGTLLLEAQAAGEVPPDLDPEVTAELLLSIFDGLVLHQILAGSGESREALRATLRRLLAEGLFQGTALPAPTRGVQAEAREMG